MSYKALNWAWQCQLPATRKFILIYLADLADEAHSCFPGQAKIAEHVSASVATVQRALKDLEDAGLLRRERRSTNGRGRSSDRFYLAVEAHDQPSNLRSSQGATLLSVATNTSLSESTPLIDPSREPPVKSAVVERDFFGEFYDAYPRPVARKAAQKAFEKAAREVAPAELVAAAQRFAADPNLPEQKFIPHPTTWLNQGRWTDSPLPSNGGSGSNWSIVQQLREEESREEVRGRISA
ncbi:helix-turn-helix domain-containing protein [Pseudoclavibacter helvolus]|uniref:helix-turn-helix domain-containing protein n=1 Tax=Pseudoclavibacter helvolus TaxID=255205 RepID=UPI0035E470DD